MKLIVEAITRLDDGRDAIERMIGRVPQNLNEWNERHLMREREETMNLNKCGGQCAINELHSCCCCSNEPSS
jgi:hypothetical protein